MSSELDVKHINGRRALPQGSKPPPIVHQFLDEIGSPYDMSAGTWNPEAMAEQLHVTSSPVGLGGGGVAINTTEATVTYTWAPEDFETEGRFRIILWAGNTNQRLGSTIYEWDVTDAPGGPPTV